MRTVFVSSTFKDMHLERDAIREISAPLLNAEARKHGDEFDFCDLRWGINTGDLDTNEGSKKVLDVCLDEIDRCNPPMVVLLGYRYGWIPEADLIKSVADRKRLEIDDLERSITALEIEYGALCNDKKFENTLFYFREIEGNAPSDYLAEDAEHEEKISALKKRIKSMTGGRIKEYTLAWNDVDNKFDGVDDFARMLAEDIKVMLMPEWKETENLTPFECERRTHWTFVHEKNVMFKARQMETQKLIKDALSQPVIIIKGEVGSGKSTLFSHMAAELENTEWTVLPFISGLTPESNSADDIIKNIVFFIEEQLHIAHYIDEIGSQTGNINYANDENDFPAGARKKHTPDEWRNKLAEMCAVYAKTGKKLLIMLDAADQLTPSEERDKLRFIPRSVSENVHFVMTCITDFNTFGWEYYTLRQLNDEDKQDVIRGALARSGRELSEPVINEMLKLKASDNPLYLSLLVQRLLMMNNDDFMQIRNRGDGIAAIEQHQMSLIKNQCPDDLDEMSAALLSEAGKRINGELVSKAADYMAVSRNGLRKKDLAAMLGEEWTEIDFSHFVNYMNDCFMQRNDGRYDFTHKSIREGFRRQGENPDRVNRDVLKYFKSLKADDPVRMSEIIYHAIKADDKRFFIDYIIECEYHDNKSYINCVAKDTYIQCMSDSGQWILDVLNDVEKHVDDQRLNGLESLRDFCNLDLANVFSESQKELEIKLGILLANTRFAEHLWHKLKTNGCRRGLSVSYDKAAGIYEVLGGWENIKTATEFYQKSLGINEALDKELCTEDSKRNVSYAYDNVARMYSRSGKSEIIERALELYLKSLEIREQLVKESKKEYYNVDLAKSYDNIASIFNKNRNIYGSFIYEQALKWYNRSLEIRERMVRMSDNEHYKSDLADSYSKVAGTCLHIYDNFYSFRDIDDVPEIRKDMPDVISEKQRNYFEQAKCLYRKCLEIRKELDKVLNTVSSKRNLSYAYCNYGDVCEDSELAFELYDESFKINERLYKELGTADSASDLMDSYQRKTVGLSYELSYGEDSEQIQRSYYEFLELQEQLAIKCGEWGELSVLYQRFADEYYEERGGVENLKQALIWYNKGIEIDERIAANSRAADAKDWLCRSRDRAINICIELGGSDNLRHALTMNNKNIKMREQLVQEYVTEDDIINITDAYNSNALIYKKIDGGEKLAQAIKKLGTFTYDRDKEYYISMLADSYSNQALIYMELGGNRNLKKALELYNKCIETEEQLDKKFNKRNLADVYNNIGYIYVEFGGDENLKQALKWCKKTIGERQQRVIESDTEDNKYDLAESYDNYALIYEKLGGSENLQRAQELRYKALEIRERQ